MEWPDSYKASALNAAFDLCYNFQASVTDVITWLKGNSYSLTSAPLRNMMPCDSQEHSPVSSKTTERSEQRTLYNMSCFRTALLKQVTEGSFGGKSSLNCWLVRTPGWVHGRNSGLAVNAAHSKGI